MVRQVIQYPLMDDDDADPDRIPEVLPSGPRNDWLPIAALIVLGLVAVGTAYFLSNR